MKLAEIFVSTGDCQNRKMAEEESVFFEGINPVKILKVVLEKERFILKNQILFNFEILNEDAGNNKNVFRATKAGYVKEVHIKESDIIEPGYEGFHN